MLFFFTFFKLGNRLISIFSSTLKTSQFFPNMLSEKKLLQNKEKLKNEGKEKMSTSMFL